MVLGIGSGLFGNAAIFGNDDIKAINENSKHFGLARATAVALLSSNVSVNDSGTLDLLPDSLSNLCSTEVFYREPSLSYACSGFLVAPDLIVTAGHCMVNTGESRNETDKYCAVYSWLFDFNETTAGDVAIANISSDRRYNCKQVIYAVVDGKAPFRDYALVQLDRPVLDRQPVPIATRPVRRGDEVAMVGYPFGTPAKSADGAKVILNQRRRQSFITDLDAFSGNSGSLVVNSRAEAIGILISGAPITPWVTHSKRQCDVINRCDASGANCLYREDFLESLPGFQRIGSEVQRIGPVRDLILKFEKSRESY